MQHFVYDPNRSSYPIAILVKETAFNAQQIDRHYVQPLVSRGVNRDDIAVFALPYAPGNRAPAKFIKERIAELAPMLNKGGVQHVMCCDSNYFKVITKERQANKHFGYKLNFAAHPDATHITVTLGLSYRALLKNPNQESQLFLGLDTFADVILNRYVSLGKGIIQTAQYPSTLSDIENALHGLLQKPSLACDLETFSLKFHKAGVGTAAFAWDEHNGLAFTCDYQAVDNESGQFVTNPEVRGLLREFFDQYRGNLKFHNATYDTKILIFNLWMKNYFDINGLLKGLETLHADLDDTQVIRYLATNNTAGNELGLKAAAHPFAGNYAVDVKDISKIGQAELLEYNLIDVLSTNWVYKHHWPTVLIEGQEPVYRDIMMPSVKTITQMELIGMPMNPMKLDKLEADMRKEELKTKSTIFSSPYVVQCTRKLREQAAEKANQKLKKLRKTADDFKGKIDFNPNSGDHKIMLLTDVMELPVLQKTKTGKPATGNKIIEGYLELTKDQAKLDVLQALIDYNDVSKILQTFIPAFQAGVLKQDGRKYLHGSYKVGGTISGRLSSSDPNMQNLPSGSRFGKPVKQAFQAPPGWIFCGADFLSLEDRINALVTQDRNKLKVYTDGYDGHCLRTFYYWPQEFTHLTETPADINSIADTHKKLRADSKGPTFALTYQGTYKTLMKNSGFSEEEAKKIEANYHSLYAESTAWAKAQIDDAAKKGYATSAFGLRIRTPLLAKSILGTKATPAAVEAEARTLGNAVSGQSYGLLTNRSMNATMERVWNSQYRFDILPISMIHDANYFLVRDNSKIVEWFNKVLIEEMNWQELPEIQHPDVKLEAALDLFYPSWADEITLPNGASAKEIYDLCAEKVAAVP